MLIKENGKYVWVDKPKSPELVEKIQKHLDHLASCKQEETKIFGIAYKVEDNKYWQQVYTKYIQDVQLFKYLPTSCILLYKHYLKVVNVLNMDHYE